MGDQTQSFPPPGSEYRVGAPPLAPTDTTAGRKRPGWLVAGIATGALLIGCCGGFGLASGIETPPKTITVASPSPYKVTEYVTLAPEAPATTAPAPAKPAAPTIEDGVWLVGIDFPAGTYPTTETVSNCYWGIYKAGTNQSDIIDNDIVDGGRPTVTLKKGQEFKSSRCGTWAKA